MPPELEEDITLDDNSGAADEQNGQGDGKGTPTVDPNEEMRKAVAQLAGTVENLAKPKPEVHQPSQAELAAQYGIFDPKTVNENYFKDFFGLPDDVAPEVLERKMKLYAETQKGWVKQAVMTALKVLRDTDLRTIRDEYTPATQFAAESRAEKLKTDFYSTYPALVDSEGDGPKFSAVVDAVAKTLADKEFPNKEAYFKALAEGAAAVVKGVFPSFDLGAKPTKTTAGTSPRLPRTSVGGSGGAGSGGQRSPVKTGSRDDSADIFAND